MKANELRIGNLIFINGRKRTVDGRLLCDIWAGDFQEDDVEPIILTE